jgi:mannose-6-phosphate isomerase-like protein (cupin superfamily)
MMQDKEIFFEKIATMLKGLNFSILSRDDSRPWGGFFLIDEAQTAAFAQLYFPGEDIQSLKLSDKLSPKILLVAPGKRLSWQYHHRRAEIWKCIEGKVGVITSETDEERYEHILNVNEIIKLKQGERHRLIGLDQWGVVAEIWLHTNTKNPSDENDIVRVQDDFGR